MRADRETRDIFRPMSSPAVPESTTTGATTCQSCGTTGSGRFCTQCGAPLAGAPCPGCGDTLSPGAKFCHRCGLAAGTAPAPAPKGSSLATTLPWAVAGIAFLALFAMLAGKGFNASRGSTLDAPSNALPNPELDGAGPGGPTGGPMAGGPGAPTGTGPMMGGAGGRAPDISKMDPTEIANRLFDRIMRLNTEGKSDSVQFFAPMAIQAYQMVEDRQGHRWDLDQRYDVGRIAEVAGALPVAKAQADTILQKSPNHLLGLILASHVAKKAGNTPAAREYAAQFARAKAGELAKTLPEYQKHASDITAGP
jgi:hypothetical protein